MPTTYYPYDNGTVGPTGPEGPQGPPGSPGTPGVVQSVNGKSAQAVVLAATDVGALPSNANATLDATYLSVNRPAGNYRVLRWLTSGVSRWEAQTDDVAETGSAAGSDFRLASRNDDGSFNKTVVHAKRSDGTISFGTTVHHGSAQVTSYGSLGLRDVGADPATTSGGVFVYSKSGKMFVKQADGTSFQIAQVSYPVTSVNGETGAVTLGAADVGAIAPIGTTENANIVLKGNGAGPLTVYGGTATDERFAVKASGSWYSNGMTNTAYNMGVGDTATDFAGGKYVLAFKNRSVAPTSTPATGAVMYAENGALKVLQSDGTTFQLAPGGSGGGTGGAVDSVNGKTGIVDLTADDVNALSKVGGTLTGPLNVTPSSGNGLTVYGGSDPATYFRVTEAGHPYSNSLRATLYNLGIGDTTTEFGGGKFALGFKNASVVPTTTPVNGAIAYAEGGKLKVLQSDGTTITVGAQTVASVNGQTGAVAIDLDDLGGVPYSEKGAANGVAPLDSAKRVPAAQLPSFAKPSDFDPTDLGLKAWSSDPAMCSVQVVYPTSGAGRVTAVKINEATSVSRIVWYFKGYAGGLKTGSWAGIYNSAGTLMRATGDMGTATYEPQEQHATGGGNSWSNLTSAVTLQPGLYYVVFKMNYTESPVDGPAILAYDNSSACPSRLGYNNMWRWASLGATDTAKTTAPSSIAVGSFLGDPKRFWVGLA